LQPDANETKLSNILAPASWTFEPNNTIDSFMLRAQTCFNSLQGIPIESLISLLILCHIDKSQFPGIHNNLLAFEPALYRLTSPKSPTIFIVRKAFATSSVPMMPRIL
jgi:hypothetical protein